MKAMLSVVLALILSLAPMNMDTNQPMAFEEEDLIFEIHRDSKGHEQYQLTKEQLLLPTEELIDEILTYPYLVELFCSNTPDVSAYDSLVRNYNGLAELQTREDAASVMILKLKEAIIEPNCLSDLYLMILLSEPIYQSRLTASERTILNQTIDSRDDTKTAILKSTQDDINNSANTYSSREIAFTVNGFSYVHSNRYAMTTGGSAVSLYSALSDYSESEKTAIANNTASLLGIEVLGCATSKYNCHSYAWYQKSTLNSYWVATISDFQADAHCTQIANARVGAIVVYLDQNYQPLHSAVISSINGSIIMCKSKWGADGLFEHAINNVPAAYSYNGSSIRYRIYDYDKNHSCTVTVDDESTHTRVCYICGWSATETHVINNITGRCVTCGYSGSTTIRIAVAEQKKFFMHEVD